MNGHEMLTELRTAGAEPLYNIGVVARMTGVPMPTLRVWERRYGFPRPARTGGGHRLYAEAEVRRLRWVKARVDEGMQTHQAIRALEHLEREGRVPETPGLMPSSERPPQDSSLTPFVGRLGRALLAHDTPQADQILGELLALYPLDNLIVDVILPAWREVGEAYEAGRISVATEHLASQYLRQRLTVWLPVGPSEHPVRPTVLACAPGDWHEGGLLVLGVLLRRHRWPVAYLGQSVPLADLASFVRATRPPAVVLTAMSEETALALADWPAQLPEAVATGRPLVCYAGRIFAQRPELRAAVPGLYLGDSIEAGLDTLEQRLREITGLG